jgi:Cys-tRNA(Pro)/Cys-tRNA(Cys) deacylase
MSRATPATRQLDAAGVSYTLHTYDYEPGAARIGLQAACALGVPAAQVLKTLLAQVDTTPVCAIVPSDTEVSLKKLAHVFGGKSARLLAQADAERISGYKVGGISPFGQRRRLLTAIEQQALSQTLVFVNGGQRGLQVQLAPQALVSLLEALVAPLVT